MKKILYFLLAVSSSAIAQTNITTPTVSGTWTLAGSPYIVQTITNVPSGQVLTIQAGVEVKFLTSTRIMVDGQLIASGTAASPIVFKANDTTGWSNLTTPNGGWNGIHFHQYTAGGVDNSRLDYCTIQDVKFGYSGPVPYANAFTAERGIKLFNCSFKHNTSGTGYYVADPPLNLNTYLATDTIEINKCNFEDNTSVFSIIRTTNYYGGYTKILNSHFHHNHLGAPIWGVWNDLLIENNEINDNTMDNDASPIKVSIGNVIIRGNKVHHNECDQLAAVGCRSGKVTIENNLICNNRQNDAFCGLTGGGGGIHLAHNEGGASFDDTYYIVRNNVIVNNYSAYGGGGIYVYHAKATISNNHIVNNYTPAQGQGILILDPNSEVYIKNNLFHTQNSPGMVDSLRTVFIFSASKLQFDNNYIPSRFFKSVQAASAYTLIGDTLDNVIGTAPDMVAPTPNNNYLTNALTSNFKLNSTSPCINEGDTTGAFPALVDYAGNNRINGVIDIGAYEYRTEQMSTEEYANGEILKLQVYPNPVSENNIFTVITPETEGKLVIYDMSGKTVYAQPVYNSQNIIQLPVESKGIYLVGFYGKKNATAKVIIR